MIRQVLMMKTFARNDGFGIAAGGEFQAAEQYHGDNAAAAGRAEHGDTVFGLEEGRRHAREWALAGLNGIGLAADESVGIRLAGLSGEIVHLVVEQDTGAFGHVSGAE